MESVGSSKIHTAGLSNEQHLSFHRMKNLCKLCKRLLNEQIKDTVGANILYLVKSKVSWLLCGCPEKAVCLFNQRKQLNVRQSLEKRQ